MIIPSCVILGKESQKKNADTLEETQCSQTGQQLLYILLLWLEENHRITYIGKDP